jgi:hypothetical protein
LVDDERTESALGLAAALGLVVAVLGLAVPAFAVPLVRLGADLRAALLAGLAARADRAAVPEALAAVPEALAAVPEALAAVPDGRAAERDREVVPDDLVADRDREVLLDDRAAERDLEAGREAADALGAALA